MITAGAIGASVLLAGCSSTQPVGVQDPTAELRARYEQQLKAKDTEIDSLQASLMDAHMEATESEPATSEPELLPPNAKPGECYARAYIPPTYKTETEQMLKSEASERIETLPAQYEWVEERVLVKEASQHLEVVPATYEWVTEDVLVKAASTKLVPVPASYGTVSEQVLVKPEHTIWKKGKGPITKIDQATGEIMCLVTIPAEYKSVTKRVLTAEATTKEVPIPAEYKTVKRKVMKTPPSTRTVEIPAEYKTVRVRKLVADARSEKIGIPAEYQTVTRRVKVSDGYMEWKSVLCETNITTDVTRSIQSALKEAGHFPGPIDGVIGRRTMTAVRAYQTQNNLPRGGLTMETLKALKVNI
jgi:hypothetical protein